MSCAASASWQASAPLDPLISQSFPGDAVSCTLLSKLPVELVWCIFDALRPHTLPSITREPSWAKPRPGLRALASTCKAMNELVKGYDRSGARGKILLATYLEPPRSRSTAEERSDFKKMISGVEHLVFAAMHRDGMTPWSKSFDTGTRLLKYLSSHPNDHSIGCITFDERIRVESADVKTRKRCSETFLHPLIHAADALASSEPRKPIHLQVIAPQINQREYHTYYVPQQAGRPFFRSGTFWTQGSCLDRISGSEDDMGVLSDLTHRRNFDLTEMRTSDCLAAFEKWCRIQYELRELTEEEGSNGSSADFLVTANLHATGQSLHRNSVTPTEIPSTIHSNEDINLLKGVFEAVIDKVRAEQLPGSSKCFAVNYGECDKLPYEVWSTSDGGDGVRRW